MALVLAIVLLLSGQQVADWAAFLPQKIFYIPGNVIDGALNIIVNAARDNARLNTEVVSLTAELQLTREAREENESLRALLGFVPPKNFKIVPAEINLVMASGIPNTVRINLGSNDSIKVSHTVISRYGVAGRVGLVSEDQSLIYLLTEPRCRVAARVQRSREMGIIRYSMSRGMYLDNCPQQGDVVVGDTIITSGLGGYFVEGLIIGTVSKVETPEKEFFYDITVDPAVNFNGLDELFILVPLKEDER